MLLRVRAFYHAIAFRRIHKFAANPIQGELSSYYADGSNFEHICERNDGIPKQEIELVCNYFRNASCFENMPLTVQEILFKLSNRTHSHVAKNKSNEPVCLRSHLLNRNWVTRKKFEDISRRSNVLFMDEFYTQLCGERSYFLVGDLARMEQALISHALALLKRRNFVCVSVPDILPPKILESCGMDPYGLRNQIYHLTMGEQSRCLSGTSEMALANLVAKMDWSVSLPLRLCSVSRCYRAEISTLKAEKGLYRVHQFNKVEMFGVTKNEDKLSEKLLEEFISIQEEFFSSLSLTYKVLEMPFCDLGLPAYRKVDIEAELPGHGFWGELSSASNCTEYQAMRFGLDGVHTVNGTACAIPRTLIAILEQFQVDKGYVLIPEVLRPYMDNRTHLEPVPKLKMSLLPYYYLENKDNDL